MAGGNNNDDPVMVVQGTAVVGGSSSGGGGTTTTTTEWNGKGEMQESKCRDPIFALLFYANVFTILGIGLAFGIPALRNNNDESESGGGGNYNGFMIVVVISILLAFVGAGMGLMILMRIPEFLIKVSLIFSIIMMGIFTFILFVAGQLFMGVIFLVFFGFYICYARAVWKRIPFATVNLVTACTSVRSNLGVTAYAYLFTMCAGVWSIMWTLAFVGSIDTTYTCDDVTNVCSDPNYAILFLLFVSLYFGQQVIQNCIHVTVAGMVGNWWFHPQEATSFCSEAVNNSFLRTITTSFGSICFGSLIVAVLQALRQLARTARDNDNGGVVACIAECILACLASLVEYFNKWAFIYVGLYGYSYMDAGKNVFQLFKNRGWEAIIADDLVSNALGMLALVMSLFMGIIAVALDILTGLFDNVADSVGNSTLIAFLLAFFVALVITNVLFNTISSAVNTVIVLFAEAPAEFQQNYPDLSTRMRNTWMQIYPGSF